MPCRQELAPRCPSSAVVSFLSRLNGWGFRISRALVVEGAARAEGCASQKDEGGDSKSALHDVGFLGFL